MTDSLPFPFLTEIQQEAGGMCALLCSVVPSSSVVSSLSLPAMESCVITSLRGSFWCHTQTKERKGGGCAWLGAATTALRRVGSKPFGSSGALSAIFYSFYLPQCRLVFEQ